MSQQLPSWRSQKDQTLWLSMLIEAMEKFSRPEWRGCPVDQRQQVALRARLAKPAMAHVPPMLRNSACGTDVACDLFAGDLETRPLSKLGAAQLGFLMCDVVAGHRHDALALGELNLDIHEVLFAEGHLG